MIQQQENKIVFIRHAQSLSNRAVHNFREERNLPDSFQVFTSIDDFNQHVIYNPNLCDCSISQIGQQQAILAKEKLKERQFDVVIISPLQRALQTCDRIFKQKNIPVFVQPLLAQTLKYSSDISKPIKDKKKRYPHYNFDSLQSKGNFWFLTNDSEEHQRQYFEHLEQLAGHLTYEQKMKEIAKFMYKTRIRQRNQTTRQRVKQIKALLEDYSKKYKRIAVVSHYYTIKHILARTIASNGQPMDVFHGANCSIHEDSLENILKYGQYQPHKSELTQ